MHQNVLAASSRYFKAMFVSGMKESQQKEFILKDIDAKTLQLLVDFCYTGEIQVTSMNVEVLLAAASHYEFTGIETECSVFLKNSLKNDKENCLWYFWIACLYNLNELKVNSKHLVEKLFMKIKNSENFLLLDFNQFREIIRSADLVVSLEEDVFNLVMAWINHDETNRRKHIENLFAEIRFTQMDETVNTDISVLVLMSTENIPRL